MENQVLIHHGSGGRMMKDLIQDLFIKYFDNDILNSLTDSAILKIPTDRLAFTTDSYVVDPLFFPGGNIGKLAVCGTVNDLAVSGAAPLFLSASFIIEAGFSLEELEVIVRSMAEEAKNAGVRIVTGDTKVVPSGKADKLFINTAGIGLLPAKYEGISHGKGVKAGDPVLINGTIGDHGMTILNARESFRFSSSLKSDCASLSGFIQEILNTSGGIRFMRDATRGGLAAVLCEFAEKSGLGIEIDEKAIPVKDEVRGLCELLGFDPLNLANEGKIIIVAAKRNAGSILDGMHIHEFGRDGSIIGRMVPDHPGKVKLKTVTGGSRWIDLPAGEQLPRIC
jgi:hydrogenase expression/formation protein HypE